jgi:hypothetical protein
MATASTRTLRSLLFKKCLKELPLVNYPDQSKLSLKMISLTESNLEIEFKLQVSSELKTQVPLEE